VIVKNLSRKSGSCQLIRYIFKYILNPKKHELNQERFIVKHNIRSKDLLGFIREFKENESRRIHTRKNQISLNHTIISWEGADREKINSQMLKDIAMHYIKIRGEGNLYLGSVLQDSPDKYYTTHSRLLKAAI